MYQCYYYMYLLDSPTLFVCSLSDNSRTLADMGHHRNHFCYEETTSQRIKLSQTSNPHIYRYEEPRKDYIQGDKEM